MPHLHTLCDGVAQAQSPRSGLHLKSVALLSVFFQCTGWYLESVTNVSDFLTLPYDAVIYKLQNVSHKASSKFQVLVGHIHNYPEPHTLPVG